MKFLAVSQRIDTDPNTAERRDGLDCRWNQFLNDAGCIPIPIPNDLKICRFILEHIHFDGILLTGGNTPAKYGGTAPERDCIDDYLIDYAISTETPLIGVCRGMQSIVLHFQGILKPINNHVGCKHYLIGEDKKLVNSFHNWAVELTDECKKCLNIDYRSEDGVIEMIHSTNNILTGIMWHPERNTPFDKSDILLFQKIFQTL